MEIYQKPYNTQDLASAIASAKTVKWFNASLCCIQLAISLGKNDMFFCSYYCASKLMYRFKNITAYIISLKKHYC